jgi:hypothetical protein
MGKFFNPRFSISLNIRKIPVELRILRRRNSMGG